jgi:hypothetical protein
MLPMIELTRATGRTWLVALCLVVSCAGPSRSQIAERDAEVRRLATARAVHMPKGVDSCVGVTLRLTDAGATPQAIAEREQWARLLSDEEVDAAIDRAGASKCGAIYVDAVREGLASPEPAKLSMSYGVDPDGKVCAVVEKARMELLDPAAVPLLEASAECLKDALFRAEFPAGRVKEKERIVRTYVLIADPNAPDKGAGARGEPSARGRRRVPRPRLSQL